MAFALLGTLVISVALWDIIVTTLTGRGAGPVSSWSAKWLWSGLLSVHGFSGSQRLLAGGGVAVVISSVLFWVLLLWAGWSLVFLASGGAIVAASTGQPADIWSTVYYAGFSLFTLGLGDYKPVGALWQVLTALCAANGLLAMTLAVTYLVPVLSAAAQKRQLAATVAALGATPSGLLRRNWNGHDFKGLGKPLSQLYPTILSLAQQHLAYPSLHYFHSIDPEASISVRLAALDETLRILDHAVRPEARPDKTALMLTRQAISLFLQVLESAHITAAAREPQAPSLESVPQEALLQEGIPMEAALAEAAEHRRLMLGFVQNDGWSWDEVDGSSAR